MSSQNKISVIGVDGNEANLENRVGVNTYAYETLKAISECEHDWRDKATFEIILRDPPKPHMPNATQSFNYLVLPGRGMWILKTLTPFLIRNRKRYSVFWTPSHYVPPLTFAKRVCSIMDLGYLAFPNQFKKYDLWQLKIWSVFSMLVSSKIIAISQATSTDIKKHYPFVEKKLNVILLGYDAKRFVPNISKIKIAKAAKKYGIDTKYILFMSTLKPSKNIEGLLTSWKLIQNNFLDTKLVIAGKKGWLFDNIFKVCEEYGITDRVVFTDFIDEGDKELLIAGASLFVLPSFWEGFGLDVLSSLACGVPVVVSNRGSLPEVVGDVGFIVNPDDTEDIAAAISRVLTMSAVEYRKLSQKGILWVKNFSWQKTAQRTIEVLLSAL